jgi:hypothetical protein
MRNPPVLDVAAKQHQTMLSSGSVNAKGLVMKHLFVACQAFVALG